LYETSTAPDALTVETSGNFVIYTVVGGVKTLLGPLLGTGLVMYLQNVVSAKTDAWRLIEGMLFVAVIVFLPGGILGSLRRTGARRILAASVSLPPAKDPAEPVGR
jgi:ABC-type branched-subunit amino acid transport system permease subunit